MQDWLGSHYPERLPNYGGYRYHYPYYGNRSWSYPNYGYYGNYYLWR